MTKRKSKRGEYQLTTTKDFLHLSNEELAVIDLKIRLIETLKRRRQQQGFTQLQLAHAIGSSQSRIAMMEGGADNVSMELACRALFALGMSVRDIGKAIQ